jgi:hypothetical protein
MGRYEPNEEILTKTGEKVDANASRLACLIYHPHFGNGKRDKNGALFVTHPDGQRKKISWNFLDEYGFKKGFKSQDGLALATNPYKFLKNKNGEIFVDNDILRPNDFSLRINSSEFSHHLHKITSNGYAMINNEQPRGIRYYVGRKFANNNDYKAIKIDNSFGAVLKFDVNGNKELVKIFQLTNYNDTRLNISHNSKGAEIRTANDEISQSGTLKDYLDKKNDLLNDHERESLLHFDKFIKVTNEIKKSNGLDILPLIESEERWQNVNKALVNTTKSGTEIGEFVKKFGANNLHYFLDSQITIEEFDKYISLGQNLKHETAKKIFDKYGEVVELAQTNIAELNDNFFAENDKKINPIEELIMRGKKLVLNYSEKLADAMIANKEELYVKLLREIDNIKKEIILFTAMFKTAFEEYGGIDFQDIKGLKFEINTSVELTKEEKNQILALSDNLYAEKPKVQQLLRDGLENAFNNDEKTKWYILKKNNKIMSTMRFDKTNKPNTLYAGSFMVENNYEGSAIGKAMEKIIFNEEMKNNQDLVAITEAEGLPISHYVEKQGWIVTGVETKKEIPFFNILKSRNNDKEYISRQKSFLLEQALALVQKTQDNETNASNDLLVKECNKIPSDSERQTIKHILNQGYAITRFLRGTQYGNKSYLVFEKIKENKNI